MTRPTLKIVWFAVNRPTHHFTTDSRLNNFFFFFSYQLTQPENSGLDWFGFGFTAHQHILGHFGCGQLP